MVSVGLVATVMQSSSYTVQNPGKFKKEFTVSKLNLPWSWSEKHKLADSKNFRTWKSLYVGASLSVIQWGMCSFTAQKEHLTTVLNNIRSGEFPTLRGEMASHRNMRAQTAFTNRGEIISAINAFKQCSKAERSLVCSLNLLLLTTSTPCSSFRSRVRSQDLRFTCFSSISKMLSTACISAMLYAVRTSQRS